MAWQSGDETERGLVGGARRQDSSVKRTLTAHNVLDSRRSQESWSSRKFLGPAGEVVASDTSPKLKEDSNCYVQENKDTKTPVHEFTRGGDADNIRQLASDTPLNPLNSSHVARL